MAILLKYNILPCRAFRQVLPPCDRIYAGAGGLSIRRKTGMLPLRTVALAMIAERRSQYASTL
jgi:hypothetical protein